MVRTAPRGIRIFPLVVLSKRWPVLRHRGPARPKTTPYLYGMVLFPSPFAVPAGSFDSRSRAQKGRLPGKPAPLMRSLAWSSLHVRIFVGSPSPAALFKGGGGHGFDTTSSYSSSSSYTSFLILELFVTGAWMMWFAEPFVGPLTEPFIELLWWACGLRDPWCTSATTGSADSENLPLNIS